MGEFAIMTYIRAMVNIIRPVTKESVKYAKMETIAKKGSNGFTRLIKESYPELEQDIHFQKYLSSIDRYAVSKGDAKFFQQTFGVNPITDEKLIDKMLKRKDLVKNGLLMFVTEENKKELIKLLRDKSITNEKILYIANLITEENAPILKKLIKDKNFNSKILAGLPKTHLKKDNVEVLRAISSKGNVSTQEMLYLMVSTNKSNSDIASKLLERAGKNTEGLSYICGEVRAIEGMSKEGLEAFKLRKNFISELLENPNFNLGKNDMENLYISKVLSVLKPENYNIAQKAILERNVDLHQLSGFLEHVNSDNQETAERLLNMVSKDTKLPFIANINPEAATKYLDEVAKIRNPEAKNLYIDAMDNLKKERLNEILNIIRTSNPENAKHACAVIKCMNSSRRSAAEIEQLVSLFEQSGRNLKSTTIISGLNIFSGDKSIPRAQFIERLVKNKAIPDTELLSLTREYRSVVEKIKSQHFSIPLQIREDKNLGKITETEYAQLLHKLRAEFKSTQTIAVDKLPGLLDKLYQNKGLTPIDIGCIFSKISVDNILLVEKYAFRPEITKINLAGFNQIYAQDLEILLKPELSVPVWMQKNLLPVLKSSAKFGEKRFEVLQDLLKREESPSSTIAKVVKIVDEKTIEHIDGILARKDLTIGQMLDYLYIIRDNSSVKERLIKLVKDTGLKGEYINQVLRDDIFKMYEQNPENVKKSIEMGVDPGIWSQCSEKIITNMLKGVEQAKNEYGVIPRNLVFVKSLKSNDLFIMLKNRQGLAYKFNKNTGKLVTISQDDKVINVKKGSQVYDSVSSERKIDYSNKTTPYRISSVSEGKNGKLQTEYVESYIEGQYDIYQIRPDGSRIRIGNAQITPNGAKHVRRCLKSLDGSKTYTAFREDKIGNSHLHSVISDKTGKRISEVTRTFKIVSKNHFVSTVNGKSYDIVFTNNKVVVTKLDSMGKKTAEKIEYAIADIPVDTANNITEGVENCSSFNKAIKLLSNGFKKYGIEPRTIDRSCVDMLKRLPGDEWFAMSRSCEFVMPESTDPMNAFYGGNSIFMSKELNNNLGVFAHELGHAKYHVLGLEKDKELMKIYNAEKKAYTANFPESRIDSIDYFLENQRLNKRGLNEACAETNLITDTIQTFDAIQDRTIFFEQYFPNTIAYVRQKFSTLA